MSRLEPAGDMVLVKDIPQESMIADIALPDNQRQPEMVFGVVMALGACVHGQVAMGDRIYYEPYAGKLVIVGGIELRSLREGQIEGYVREE